MPFCAYCGQEKKQGFSEEHIIPQAIGGNLLQNELKMRVCARCNNILGMFVDAPFTKSFLLHNARAESALRYVDLDSTPTLPFSYMGISTQFAHGTKECDVWLGPAGDTILHFHEPYPQLHNVAPVVGVPAYCRGRRAEIDPGFVITFVGANNPRWLRLILQSVQDQFRDSALYTGNMPTPVGGRFVDMPGELAVLSAEISTKLRSRHQLSMNVPMQLDYADRFLAKLALALTTHVLGDRFAASQSAAMLREYMWEGDQERRSQLQFNGTSLLPSGHDLARIMAWEGGHAICLHTTGGTLMLFSSFYETQNSAVVVSREPDLWRDAIQPDDGVVFVIAPGLQRYVGPKSLSSFIGHKFMIGHRDRDLDELEARMQRHSVLPPFTI